SVDRDGDPIELPTGPAVWGMPGTDAQHTFFQWLHQGSDGAPVDFIVCRHADHRWPDHHRQLLANCLAQRATLLRGKTLAEVGRSEPEGSDLAAHKTTSGGRPSRSEERRVGKEWGLRRLSAQIERSRTPPATRAA